MQSLNELLTGTRESFTFIIPEIVLSGALIVILFAGLFSRTNNLLFNVIAVAASLISLFIIMSDRLLASGDFFNGMLHRGGFEDFLMTLVDISVILTCLMSFRPSENRHRSEYYALILAISLGGHLLLMSNNLIMIFLSLELISISSYVLAGYLFNRTGSEGALKYFLFGAIASAIMLYGFTILYGFTGTLDYTSREFFDRLVTEPSPLLLTAGLMGLAGFLFKMAAVPMQPWAPDVYEAAPMPVIAYLSVAPKLAALGILAKFTLALHFFGQGQFDWQLIISIVAMLTISVGNLAALWQKNPKRMMAYSSIAHSGYLLVGVAAFLPEGLQFMLFYSAIYLLMNFSVFIYLMYFEKQEVISMNAFSGKGRSDAWAAVGITIGLVALTGLPPTSGFTAKLFIFSGLWESYSTTDKPLLLWLLVIGLLNTVISLFFYMRIPYYAFIKGGERLKPQKKPRFENFLGFILVLLIVAIFFLPGLLMGLINRINFVL